MALIDVVEWQPTSNDVFAYKFPNSNLSTATQLIVRESQEAVLFSKGELMGKFGPGKHQLTTENLPILRKLYGIPFGGKNPFFAEVWFVNKTVPLTIDWKTTPMRYLDPDYGQMIPLVARGRYGLKVVDAERFLVQLVGTLTSFTANDLTNHFTGRLISKTNSVIMNFMSANSVGINNISAYLEDLSKFLNEPMAEFWNTYGFKLVDFFVTEVNLDTSTAEGKKIAEALSDRSAQGIAGFNWQQKQAFDVANNAASQGSGMGILGVAMMTGALAGGNGGSQLLTPQGNQPVTSSVAPGQHARKEVFCSNCGKKFETTYKFCPHCGDEYNPCPACGADNSSKAVRCVTCGTQLRQAVEDSGYTCGKCHAQINPGLKFCPHCGNKL